MLIDRGFGVAQCVIRTSNQCGDGRSGCGKFKGRRGAVTARNGDSQEPKCVVSDNGYAELKWSCGKGL